MGANSKIEWCDHTWNCWRGCAHVHVPGATCSGCDHCYAEAGSKQNPAVLGQWGDDAMRAIAAADYWQLPYKWDQQAKAAGERYRVFSLSYGDWLEDRMELVPPRVRMLRTVAETSNLDWLLLTKRPENWARLLRECLDNWKSTKYGQKRDQAYWWAAAWLNGSACDNIRVGASVEHQLALEHRMPHLLMIPGPLFLSLEPLLGPVDVSPWIPSEDGFVATPDGPIHADDGAIYPDWIIAGGESGKSPEIRPSHPSWFRQVRGDCQNSSEPIAFFFKQWGEWLPIDEYSPFVHGPDDSVYPHRLLYRDGTDLPDSSRTDLPTSMYRVGKKAAGRLIDGREWSDFPKALVNR